MYHRQELLNLIDLFTPQNLIDFYSNLFDNLNLSNFQEYLPSKFGPKGFSRHALLRAFIVMKCEKFALLTDLKDFLNNNLKIAHLCGFDILKPLPSYTVFQRFIKNLSNDTLKEIFKNQVLELKKLGVISPEFVSLDSTPIKANTKQNNPKSFTKSKFKKSNQPKSDKDCKLGVHSASNEITEKNFEYYWGYKNFVLCDAISGLPIDEITTTAEKADISMQIPFLTQTNQWFDLNGTYFIADKGFDSKANHNFIKNYLHGLAFIARNKRGTKKPNTLPTGNPICEAGLAMHKDGRQYLKDSIKQKFCCPFRTSKDDTKCPCNHQKYFNGKRNRGCVKYKSIGTDYRASINTESLFFKKIYSLRTESERYNSRLKKLNLENAFVRNMNSVANLTTLGHICLLTSALTAIKLNQPDKTKSLTGLKRSA